MDVLKCAAMESGKQFVVTGRGMTSMLVLFANNWAFHNKVIV